MRKRRYKKLLRYPGGGSGWRMEKLKWALSVKKGDLIYTCAGSNEYVEDVYINYSRECCYPTAKGFNYKHLKRGYFISDVDFVVRNPYREFSAHGCDLFACGLGPPATREWILKDLHNDLDNYYDYEFWKKYHSREVMEKQEREDRLYQSLCVRGEEPFDEKGVCTLDYH